MQSEREKARKLEKDLATISASAKSGGDKDRAKYLAIGESDRMTLRFVKPAK